MTRAASCARSAKRLSASSYATARTVANIERTPIETFLAQFKAGTADEAGLIAAVVYAIRAATTTR
jgi:hypothetical protein